MVDATATYQSTDGKSWPERRRQAPTSMELYKANVTALEAAGVSACQMRFALVGEKVSFYFRFDGELPRGRLGFTFPMMYVENLINEGWTKYFLTLDISREGQLITEARGRFAREGVTLDVLGEYVRIVGQGRGVGQDLVTWTDTRNKEQGTFTMEDTLAAKFKDGTNKFCRGGDSLRDLSIEGYVAVLTRRVKDTALRRKAIKV